MLEIRSPRSRCQRGWLILRIMKENWCEAFLLQLVVCWPSLAIFGSCFLMLPFSTFPCHGALPKTMSKFLFYKDRSIVRFLILLFPNMTSSQQLALKTQFPNEVASELLGINTSIRRFRKDGI
jgi:hypothetical protein